MLSKEIILITSVVIITLGKCRHAAPSVDSVARIYTGRMIALIETRHGVLHLQASGFLRRMGDLTLREVTYLSAMPDEQLS